MRASRVTGRAGIPGESGLCSVRPGIRVIRTVAANGCKRSGLASVRDAGRTGSGMPGFRPRPPLAAGTARASAPVWEGMGIVRPYRRTKYDIPLAGDVLFCVPYARGAEGFRFSDSGKEIVG